jgi:hypothetical protein
MTTQRRAALTLLRDLATHESHLTDSELADALDNITAALRRPCTFPLPRWVGVAVRRERYRLDDIPDPPFCAL